MNVRKETAFMRTRDGVRLDADIYRPDAAGKFETGQLPVLLMRQPYGRAIASTVVYAHPTWYAAQGYIVVIQDVRGRGTSEGVFKLFAHEIEDGEDTVNWVATLPGSSGQVGMYGFSYQGMTQLYAAATRPPALKTICPAMIGYDLYTDWAYEGGAFCLYANLGWALQLAAETARLKQDEAAYLALAAAVRNLPLGDRVTARPDVIQLAPDSFYHEWLDHPEPGDYWNALSPKTYLQSVDLPMLHIGGWFDPFMRGTLNLYQAMVSRSQQRQQLIVGAWAHLPWSRRVGTVDFGPEAASPCDRLQVRWFDQFLKGRDTGILAEPPVTLFEIGSNHWRNFDTWNSAHPIAFYLSGTGLAGMRDDDGRLVPQSKLKTQNSKLTLQSDTIVHDPWRPVPAIGGHAMYPSGRVDRATVDSRSDVLTYTSAPLTEDLHLMGTPIAVIHCTADAPSFDLSAVLSEVHSNGSVYPIAQGYVRATAMPVEIPLQPVCIKIPHDRTVRLSLSAACFPAYPVNPGTGATAGDSRAIAQQIITLTVYSDTSHILLPVTLTASQH